VGPCRDPCRRPHELLVRRALGDARLELLREIEREDLDPARLAEEDARPLPLGDDDASFAPEPQDLGELVHDEERALGRDRRFVADHALELLRSLDVLHDDERDPARRRDGDHLDEVGMSEGEPDERAAEEPAHDRLVAATLRLQDPETDALPGPGVDREIGDLELVRGRLPHDLELAEVARRLEPPVDAPRTDDSPRQPERPEARLVGAGLLRVEVRPERVAAREAARLRGDRAAVVRLARQEFARGRDVLRPEERFVSDAVLADLELAPVEEVLPLLGDGIAVDEDRGALRRDERVTLRIVGLEPRVPLEDARSEDGEVRLERAPEHERTIIGDDDDSPFEVTLRDSQCCAQAFRRHSTLLRAPC
jgi:hypothetical protein